MKGPTETWLDSQGTNEIYVEESGLLAFAREQDAKLAQAEAERDKYKAEARSLNRERAAEVARADAAEQRAETAGAERDALLAATQCAGHEQRGVAGSDHLYIAPNGLVYHRCSAASEGGTT